MKENNGGTMKKLGLLLFVLIAVGMHADTSTSLSKVGRVGHPKKVMPKSLKVALHTLETTVGLLLTAWSSYWIHEYRAHVHDKWCGNGTKCDRVDFKMPILFGGPPPEGKFDLNYGRNVVVGGANIPKLGLGLGLTVHGLMQLYNELDIPAQIKHIQRLLRERAK
jgi:hypothetical protein